VQRLNDSDIVARAWRVYRRAQERKEIVDMNDIRPGQTNLPVNGVHSDTIRSASPSDSNPLSRLDLFVRDNELVDLMPPRSQQLTFQINNRIFPTSLIVTIV